jgi:hypothetical protein
MVNHHGATDPVVRYSDARGHHYSGRFVAADLCRAPARGAPVGVQVGAAQTRGFHADHDLVRTRLRIGPLDKLKLALALN